MASLPSKTDKTEDHITLQTQNSFDCQFRRWWRRQDAFAAPPPHRRRTPAQPAMHGRFLLALLALVQAAVAQRKQIEVLGQPQSRQPLADELKRVFFSGDPWLIECISAENIAAAGADDQPEDYAHSAVQVAMAGRSPLLPAEVNVGLLDCQKRLPSRKNTIERFKCAARAHAALPD